MSEGSLRLSASCSDPFDALLCPKRRWRADCGSALVEYFLLWGASVGSLFLTEPPLELPWYAAPIVLLPWLFLRWPKRQSTGTTVSSSVRSFSQSHLWGFLLSSILLCIFFGVPFARLPAFAVGSALAMLTWRLVAPQQARPVALRWLLTYWNKSAPGISEVAALTGSVWIWNRLSLPSMLPAIFYLWIAGSAGAIVWLMRRSSTCWHRLLGPLVALPPVIWALADTPHVKSVEMFLPLIALALAVAGVHGLVVRRSLIKPDELARVWGLGLAGLWLCEPFLHPQANGAGDAHWYSMVLADALAQWRAGIFPPLIGQSEYAFNGSSFPGCFAPYYQWLGIMVDVVSGGSLSVYSVQHVTVAVSLIGGLFLTYHVLRSSAPALPNIAALLALLYVASPTWLGAIYSMDMYMTFMTLPWLPSVFHGCLRTFVRLDTRALLWIVLPLSATWHAHSPVALWTTVGVGVSQLFRLMTWSRSWWTELRWLLGAGALFLFTTCLPFATAHSADPQVDKFRHDYVMATLAEHWKAAWSPVSSGADRLTDQHFGWSLALVAVAGGCWIVRKNQRSLGSLLAVAGGALLLLLPLPTIQDLLWQTLPEKLKLVTNNWPSQRIYPVLTAALVVGGGIGLMRAVRRRHAAGYWLTAGLCVGIAWSLAEASKFQRRGRATLLDPESSVRRLLPENLVLTRYAYEMFGRRPDYVTNGMMDPWMKHRLLDIKSLAEIASNPAAASSSGSSRTFTLHSRAIAEKTFELSPAIPLRPGRRYLLEFVFSEQNYSGELRLLSDRLDRSYRLPADGGQTGFGSGPGQGNFISLWTSGNATEIVRWRYLSLEKAPPANFAQVRITEIASDRLPIQIKSLAPYRVMVRSPQPAWLEAPRMFLPGYEARAGFDSADIVKSPQGTVLVRVPAGTTEIKMDFVGPTLVRIAFTLTSIAWLALAMLAFWRLLLFAGKRRPPRPLAPIAGAASKQPTTGELKTA